MGQLCEPRGKCLIFLTLCMINVVIDGVGSNQYRYESDVTIVVRQNSAGACEHISVVVIPA